MTRFDSLVEAVAALHAALYPCRILYREAGCIVNHRKDRYVGHAKPVGLVRERGSGAARSGSFASPRPCPARVAVRRGGGVGVGRRERTRTPSTLTGEHTPAESFAFDGGWSGIAVDNSNSTAAGTIYVADPEREPSDKEHAVVDRFRRLRGEFEYEAPQLTGELTHFVEPDGVATDADGDVYVSDVGNEMVREYSPEGAEIAKFSAPGLLRSVTVDAKGDIFMWADEPHEIKRSSDTATNAESTTAIPETESATADGSTARRTRFTWPSAGG
jgi:hypothetical protein